MSSLRLARVSLVCFVALVLQVCVTAQLPVGHAIVDVVLVAAIAAGLAAGPQAGAGVGFGCGLVIDLLGAGPVGLTSLVYTLVGYAVGVSQIGVLRSNRLIPLATAVLASVVAVVSYALIGEVLGQNLLQVASVTHVAVVTTIGAAVLTLPARRAMAWAFAVDERSRMRGVARW